MLPLYIDLSDKRILVFGGGSVAERKICQILETGEDVKEGKVKVEVYSLDFTSRVEELCEKRTIQCFRGNLWDQNVEELLKGAFLILICTNDEALNDYIFNEAAKFEVLINYRDKGNAFMSSVLNKGGFLISISTGGKGPALARYLKEKIASLIGDKEEKMLYIQKQLREYLKERINDERRRKEILTCVLSDYDCWDVLDDPLEVAKERIFRIVEDKYV
ncbi:MAG: bifunctional precorrin-2 dehydrogenase/sirohydrochlorin ferrochelatase [Methanophagales archaeon]|nr:bifunctional precorrin-2 dehydrogenase/sirohydrochlorin ferrochelatase [Methanophagales archaeon]